MPCPSVLTMHDLIPMLLPGDSRRAPLDVPVARVVGPAYVRACRYRIAGHPRRYPGTVPCRLRFPHGRPSAADPDFTVQPADTVHNLRQRYRLWDPFVLYVSGNQRHKNLVRLIPGSLGRGCTPLPAHDAGDRGLLDSHPARGAHPGRGAWTGRKRDPLAGAHLRAGPPRLLRRRVALRVPQPLRGLRPAP